MHTLLGALADRERGLVPSCIEIHSAVYTSEKQLQIFSNLTAIYIPLAFYDEAHLTIRDKRQLRTKPQELAQDSNLIPFP